MKGITLSVEQAFDFLSYVAQRAVRDRVLQVASALGYTTLLSLVPLLAVALAILTVFPAFEATRVEIEAFILKNFVPESGQIVERYLAHFISGTGKLTAVGVLGLALTSLLMLATIENAFNVIFRVVRHRPIVMRVVLYWSFLTLGPLIIGAGVSLTSWLSFLHQTASGWNGLANVASRLFPWIVTVVVFTLLYMTVPNRRVMVRDAIIGAGVAAVLFALLRSGLVFSLVANIRAYQTIYGALATLPILLVWMYLSWIVVLFGAVLTAALPEWRLRHGMMKEDTPLHRIALAVGLLQALHTVSHKQGGGLDRTQILSATGATEEYMVYILTRLAEVRFVARTVGGQWVLVRSLEETPLSELFRILDVGLLSLPTLSQVGKKGLPTPLEAVLHQVVEAESQVLSQPISSVLTPDDQPGRHLHSTA